jgi:hypothetical protein
MKIPKCGLGQYFWSLAVEFIPSWLISAYTFSMSNLQNTKNWLSKRDFKRELIWFCGCALVCFLVGGTSAWLGTTEDYDRAARHEGEAVNYEAMHKAANKDFLFYGAVFVASAIPLYVSILGIRLLVWRFRHSD